MIPKYNHHHVYSGLWPLASAPHTNLIPTMVILVTGASWIQGKVNLEKFYIFFFNPSLKEHVQFEEGNEEGVTQAFIQSANFAKLMAQIWQINICFVVVAVLWFIFLNFLNVFLSISLNKPLKHCLEPYCPFMHSCIPISLHQPTTKAVIACKST